MQLVILLIALGGLAAIGYYLARRKLLGAVGRESIRPHSMPSYHSWYVAVWCALPSAIVLLSWLLFEERILEALLISHLGPEYASLSGEMLGLLLNDIRNLAAGDAVSRAADPALLAAAERYSGMRDTARAALLVGGLALAVAGLAWSWHHVAPDFRARHRVERVVRIALILASCVAVVTTVGIILSVLFESIRFFSIVSVGDFLFGLKWSPQTAIREDQVGSSGAFGAVPLFTGTLLITLIAMVVALPIGLFSAIYMAEFASPRVRNTVKPILEILAGVPTVVYGFFAALTVAPALRGFGETIGLDVASESALAAGAVMGIMIIPFISSLSDDAIVAVPRSLREGSLAMGATRSETVIKVILPAALPGIVAACLLAVSRAIGETMIVVMAAGLAAKLTANPLEAVTTVTAQMVTLLVGDQEFDSAKTLAAFALGLALFLATLALNVLALYIARKYREQYE
ncbi:MAG: Phosphate transport system permease protein PstC 1 [Alphaproteobacteria bacterium MarineAlpha10_Bin1]|nr:MAG: Phosphate transport system permease protein PstC 1 [Alphaproteobacteria bacterium MarineAlpha10_Bin1]